MARPKVNPDTVEKICPTCNKTFVVSFYKRNITRFCSKECAQHHPDTKLKMINSQKVVYDTKYGGKHPMQTVRTQNNFKNAMVKKYGVDHPGKMENHIDKVKKTLLQRYGSETYNNIEKIKQTCLSKYGADNFVKTEKYKIKNKESCLKKYGVECFSKSTQFKNAHYDNMFEKFQFDSDFKNFTPKFTRNEYEGVTKNKKKYPFECKRCKNVENHLISGGFFPLCINCDRLNTSKTQKEIYNFIKSIISPNEIIDNNNRTILYPQEVDIYIPSKKLAIEMDSLYWHSEMSGGKNKLYHINKTKKCQFKELRLIHIFENEWIYKRNIVESIIKHAVGVTERKINGRLCKLKQLSSVECSNFLESNHLQGDSKSPIRIGLFFEEELVSVMTFSKPRYDKKYEYELSRFCNKANIVVRGSAEKLFNYFIKNFKPSSIVTYSDRRYFGGMIYNLLGFSFVIHTEPNYFYIINHYSQLKGRIQFQKHKLKNLLPDFDSNLTEWENMKNHGFDRIWDCGNSKWVWKSS